jgi:hypothetical protein
MFFIYLLESNMEVVFHIPGVQTQLEGPLVVGFDSVVGHHPNS